MKRSLFVIIMISLISQYCICHLTKHEQQNGRTNQQNGIIKARRLKTVTYEVQYILEITGLKQIGLFTYTLALKLAGLQNLLIWQVLHLYQETKSEGEKLYFSIGDFIHGYANPNIFTFQGAGQGYLFEKLNLMWEVTIVFFIIGGIGRFVVGYWLRNKVLEELKNIKSNIQRNIFDVQVNPQQQKHFQPIIQPSMQHVYQSSLHLQVRKPIIQPPIMEGAQNQGKDSMYEVKKRLSFKHRDSMIRMKKMGVSNLQTCDGSGLRRGESQVKMLRQGIVNYTYEQDLQGNKQTQNKIKLQQEPCVIRNSQNDGEQSINFTSSINHYYNMSKSVNHYSNVLLTWIVFNLIINSLSITFYGLVVEIITFHTVSYSGGVIVLTQGLMLLISLSVLVQSGCCENRLKFKTKSNSHLKYWLVVITERILYSTVIASRWQYAIVLISCFKLIVFLFSIFVDLWKRKSHYYRFLVENFIHLLVFMLLTFDQLYLQNQSDSSNSIAWILLFLLALSSLISLIFIFKDLKIITCFLKIVGIKSIQVHDCSNLNKNLSNLHQTHDQTQSQNSRKVKFNQITQIIPNQPNIKGQNTQKIIKTNLQLQNQQNIKEKQSSSQFILDKKFKIKSQSTIKISSRIPMDKIASHLYAKTQKNITSHLDDALRAQKTQQMVIEETKQQQENSSYDAEIVSIQLENERNQNSQI